MQRTRHRIGLKVIRRIRTRHRLVAEPVTDGHTNKHQRSEHTYADRPKILAQPVLYRLLPRHRPLAHVAPSCLCRRSAVQRTAQSARPGSIPRTGIPPCRHRHELPPVRQRRTTAQVNIQNIWLGVDCLNLFGINNVNSYYWVTDVTSQQYAVPNYLTGRQFNVRATFEF